MPSLSSAIRARSGSSLALVAIVVAAIAVHCLLFFPGYVSFDVRYQLAQAQGMPISDVSPPGQILLLRGLQTWLPGTGGLLLLNQLLFWLATGLLAARSKRAVVACGLMLAVLLCPPLLVLQPHVWTDLHLLSVLALATALALLAPAQATPSWRVLLSLSSLGLLMWSCWIRHNAVLAALPLLWLLSFGFWPAHAYPWSWMRRAAGCLALALALLAARQLSSVAVEQPVSVWAVTPMWDLQALSVSNDEVLLPPEMIGAGMSVDELRRAFSPHTAVPLFAKTPSGVSDPTVERFSSEKRDALVAAWVEAIWRFPMDWIQHRHRVFSRLLGEHAEDDLRYMVDSPEFLDAEVAPQGWRGSLHGVVRTWIEGLKNTPWVQAGWVYVLALAAISVAVLLRQRMPPSGALCLLASAALYTGSLWLLTPSAELRYLAWPLWAALIALYLSLIDDRDTKL